MRMSPISMSRQLYQLSDIISSCNRIRLGYGLGPFHTHIHTHTESKLN